MLPGSWGAIDWTAVEALVVCEGRELLPIDVWIDARPALSHGWVRAAILKGKSTDGARWDHPSGTVVLESICRHDAHVWYHLSASRPGGVLDWARLKRIRSWFLGDDIECYMIFPPSHRWVNINPRVLHLWAALDAPGGVLPAMEGLFAGTLTI